MAETFCDSEAMEKIRAASNTIKAEEAMKEIKGFDEAAWDAVSPTGVLIAFFVYCQLSNISDQNEGVGGWSAHENGSSTLDPESTGVQRQSLHCHCITRQGERSLSYVLT